MGGLIPREMEDQTDSMGDHGKGLWRVLPRGKGVPENLPCRKKPGTVREDPLMTAVTTTVLVSKKNANFPFRGRKAGGPVPNQQPPESRKPQWVVHQ